MATAKFVPPQANLISILFQVLVDEHFEFLQDGKFTDISGDRLDLFQLFLLLLELPEPLVHLILLQIELLGQNQSLLARRHLTLVLLELAIQHVHLRLVLPIAAIARGSRYLELLINVIFDATTSFFLSDIVAISHSPRISSTIIHRHTHRQAIVKAINCLFLAFLFPFTECSSLKAGAFTCRGVF